MHENFTAALNLTLRFEGGYVDDPHDPGGVTNMGITRATLAQFRHRPVTRADIRALDVREAAAIYRRMFWQAVCGDELPAGVDLAVFDFAVNSGSVQAILQLQKTLSVEPDGILGPLSLDAARHSDTEVLIDRLCAGRLHFLEALPTFPKFGRGWSKRIAGVRQLAISLAEASESFA